VPDCSVQSASCTATWPLTIDALFIVQFVVWAGFVYVAAVGTQLENLAVEAMRASAAMLPGEH
jgi:hypothetical protein